MPCRKGILQLVRGILKQHAKRYPLMTPTDAVKLLYQNEFGVGHLIASPDAFRERLLSEMAAVSIIPERPLYEDIGCGFIRIMLNSPGIIRIDPDDLVSICIRTAERCTGSAKRFQQKLAELTDLTAEGIFSFTSYELETRLNEYDKALCPPVSHSETYRRAYAPAYRVAARSVLKDRIRRG